MVEINQGFLEKYKEITCYFLMSFCLCVFFLLRGLSGSSPFNVRCINESMGFGWLRTFFFCDVNLMFTCFYVACSL